MSLGGSGRLLRGLREVGIEPSELGQLRVEFALQRERLAAALLVAVQAILSLARAAFLLLEVDPETVEDMFDS